MRLQSPFVALVEGAADLPDHWFLDRLGLRPPSRLETGVPAHGRHVLLGEAGSWKVLADTFAYELWSCAGVRPLLAKLSKQRTVFSYGFGECDDSHAIRVLQGGELTREWVVDDQFGGGAATAVVDNGPPLDGERGVFTFGDDYAAYFRRLAAAHAPDIDDALRRARAWHVRPQDRLGVERETELRAGSWAAQLR